MAQRPRGSPLTVEVPHRSPPTVDVPAHRPPPTFIKEPRGCWYNSDLKRKGPRSPRLAGHRAYRATFGTEPRPVGTGAEPAVARAEWDRCGAQIVFFPSGPKLHAYGKVNSTLKHAGVAGYGPRRAAPSRPQSAATLPPPRPRPLATHARAGSSGSITMVNHSKFEALLNWDGVQRDKSGRTCATQLLTERALKASGMKQSASAPVRGPPSVRNPSRAARTPCPQRMQ